MNGKHGLANTLDQLVRQAEARPGEAKRQALARGLRVDVMVKDGTMHVQISRDNTWPSYREWQTVANNFPSPVPATIAPMRIYDQKRYYLKAHWMKFREDLLDQMSSAAKPH